MLQASPGSRGHLHGLHVFQCKLSYMSGGGLPVSVARRKFLRASLGASAAALWSAQARPLLIPEALAGTATPTAFKPLGNGTLLGILPFVDDGDFPRGKLIGEGLAARQVLDLSRLDTATLVTPTDQFFIRTGLPGRLQSTANWQVRVRGLVDVPAALTLAELMPDEKSMGTHLLECAGNSRIGGFGLMSTAQWSGIPISRVLEKIHIKPQATRLIVSGFDEHTVRDPISYPGASWIFTFDQLQKAGAFLATRMNKQPLTKDHGFPVRFVMPGWYGCTCIKWLNQILLVDDSAPATGHMKEFATRTFQDGIPSRARDFKPAVIDLSAMPVRVEAWRVNDKRIYRLVGILWGGDKAVDALLIRFNPDTSYVRVKDYQREGNATWGIWSYVWEPPATGRYTIRLKVDDAKVSTRQLDRGFYDRTVQIDSL
jgi:DMSO/TMAO reductase YedYZ molybdopterin-dependent catalytic subunit